jgi:hypothetical protein
MYFACFHLSLKSGILSWGNSKNLKKSFKPQKRVIRLIANVSSTTSCKPYFNELKIMTLPCTYIYKLLVNMEITLNRFKANSLIYSYNTRKGFGLFVTSHNTKLFKQSFAHKGVLIFNKLSSEIKNTDPITKFEKILFNFLIQKSFYNGSSISNL